AVLAERCSESLGLGILQLKAVDDHEAVLCLGGKRHLETESANLLVERLLKLALAGTVSLTTTDKHRSAAIAVTSRAAALLATPLLARASNVRTLASSAGSATTVFELPGNDAVQDVSARLNTENGVIELDVASSVAVEILDLHLHGSALLVRVGFGRDTLSLIVLNHDLRLSIRFRSKSLLVEDRTGERSTFRHRKLHSITNQQPAILRTGDRALHEDQPANRIGANNFQVLLSTLTVAHMAGHLLVLEDLARILAITGRTVSTVADGNAVRSTHTAETPALHRTGKTLAL